MNICWTSLALIGLLLTCRSGNPDDKPAGQPRLPLPKPAVDGPRSLEKALSERRSVRRFGDRPLDLPQLGQLLWSAQGVNRGEAGYRTAPSAGALYPIEVLIAVGQVTGLAAGVYRYRPDGHLLERVSDGDVRPAIAAAALGQNWLAKAPAVFVITGVPRRTQRKYGDRAIRYVYMEAGHAAQNLLLQAVVLGLGGGIVGAFDDRALGRLLHLDDGEQPMLVLPVGTPG